MRQELSGEVPGRVGLMRLICPNCDAQYEVDAAMIPASGRDVQCSNCGKTWFQGGASAETEPVSPREGSSGHGLTDEAREFFSRDETDEPDAELVSETGPDADNLSEDGPQDPWKDDFDAEEEPALEVVAEDARTEEPEQQVEEPEEAREPEPEIAAADTPEETQDDTPEDTHDDTPEDRDDHTAEAAAEEPAAHHDDMSDDDDDDVDQDDDDDDDAPRPAPERPDIDAAVLGVLRAEAERELAARRAEEAEALESQPDLGLGDPERAPAGEGAISARTARLRGNGTDEDQSGARKTLLPDIDEINSTLTATSDRVSATSQASQTGHEVQKRRSGFRMGFAAVMVATAVLILLYLYAPQLGRLVPALEPSLASYVDWANGVRLSIDGFLERSVERLNNLLLSSDA